jgi:hypothetical protein
MLTEEFAVGLRSCWCRRKPTDLLVTSNRSNPVTKYIRVNCSLVLCVRKNIRISCSFLCGYIFVYMNQRVGSVPSQKKRKFSASESESLSLSKRRCNIYIYNVKQLQTGGEGNFVNVTSLKWMCRNLKPVKEKHALVSLSLESIINRPYIAM